VEKLVSAGGVVYRLVDGRIDTVVCGRREPLRWSLPKGTPDEGETLEQTALREVREETGLEVEIEAPIGNINYWFVSPDNRRHFNKTVYFYLMAHRGGCTDRHDPEFDEVRWLPSDEAMKSLVYPNEARVLGVALDIIKKQGVRVRHEHQAATGL
jgi:8-oxo-dGTP pyrophosphatase MutT (NUDIX family)